jgi:uncharacterized protein (TIGR02118 family)
MIKASVMYANRPGAGFDPAYNRDKHMPLVNACMGHSCRVYTVDKGLAGMEPGEPATYVAMCHIYCDSVAALQAGFSPHAPCMCLQSDLRAAPLIPGSPTDRPTSAARGPGR